MPTSSILRFAQVREKTGLSRATVYRRIRAGTFPAPLDLGEGGNRSLGWLEDEIDAWITDRPRVVPQGHGRSKAEAIAASAA
ncbi:MAG: AlpA family phage regulatory protein [Candidatus Hydrogenedentes bacterium]|nr:AlpA family phage regulatory protein [Candidatus Hydrogenedentota bacterium]